MEQPVGGEPHLLTLPDGRALAWDDVGDPSGVPVVYLHGTPDSRLARHPDDGVAHRLGVRLIAVDRPGAGHSTFDPSATFTSVARDIDALLDHLALDRTAILAWSAGAMYALALGARRGPQAAPVVGIAAGLVPHPAYRDHHVLAAAGAARRMIVEMADELGPAAAAAEIGPYLAPDPPTLEHAREHLAAQADDAHRRDLARVPGADEQLARSLAEAVRHGTAGLVRDLELALSAPHVELAAMRSRVALWYGAADEICPVPMGHWYAAHLPEVDLTVWPDAGHAGVLARWEEVLTRLRDSV